MDEENTCHRKAIIGNIKSSFWLYDSETGFDLTHPPTPTSTPVSHGIRIQTTTDAITIDPAKTALVVIDMQNFFLSTALGRSPSSNGLKAQQALLQHAIPAARKAGIRIVWLNWGLTEADLTQMPPATVRAFGFDTVEALKYDPYVESKTKEQSMVPKADESSLSEPVSTKVETLGKNPRIYRGLGNNIGLVTLDDGTVTDAGRMLMRDQWNTSLTPELMQAYHEGSKHNPADVWVHKNRMSGLWGASTPCTEFLDAEGIKTLFFAGVNTDQCVGGSVTDAFSKGYDCILLSDGAATSSPASCQAAYEYNAAGTYGFCTSCKDLSAGVEAHQN